MKLAGRRENNSENNSGDEEFALALPSNKQKSMHEVMQLVILLLFALMLFAILMSKGNRRSHSYFKVLPLFRKHNTIQIYCLTLLRKKGLFLTQIRL